MTLPDLNPTQMFWLAAPIVLYLGYWLAPLLTLQRNRKPDSN